MSLFNEKRKHNDIKLTFSGGIFEKEEHTPSYIIEDKLSALRVYGKSLGIEKENIKVKIERGSLIINIINSAGEVFDMIAPLIVILCFDYSKGIKRIKITKDFTVESITFVIEMIKSVTKDKDGKLEIFDGKKVHSLNHNKAKLINEYLSSEKEKEYIVLKGKFGSLDRHSGFYINSSKYGKVKIPAPYKSIKEFEEIANISTSDSFERMVEIKGWAFINEKGEAVYFTPDYNTLKIKENPQKKLDF